MMDARVFSDTFDSDYRTIIAVVRVIINQLATCGRLSYLAVTGSTRIIILGHRDRHWLSSPQGD